MNSRRLQSMYIIGIVLNAGAMMYAISDNSPLFAVTFAIVMGYLGIRYWMVTNA